MYSNNDIVNDKENEKNKILFAFNKTLSCNPSINGVYTQDESPLADHKATKKGKQVFTVTPRDSVDTPNHL